MSRVGTAVVIALIVVALVVVYVVIVVAENPTY
jgi:hypothetical protein